MENLAHPRNRAASWSSEHTETQIMPKTMRDNARIGQPAIYIEPKEMSDNEPDDDEKFSENDSNQRCDSVANLGEKLSDRLSEKLSEKVSSKKSIPNIQAKSKRTIVQQPSEKYKTEPYHSSIQSSPPLLYRRVRNSWLVGLQLFIFIGFLVGSFPSSQTLAYIDLATNIICFLKIVIIHGWLYVYNSRNQKEIALIKEEGGSKPIVLFINRIERYEFVQMWSIIITPLCMAYLNQPLLGQIFPALKTFRLIFPILINQKKAQKLRMNVFIHILKLTLFTGLFLLVLSVIIGLLASNATNFYCLTNGEMVSLTQDESGEISPQPCGISQSCEGVEKTCRNIYEYAETNEQRRKIDGILGIDKDVANFEKSVLNSFLATQAIGGVGFYLQYSPLLSSFVVGLLTLVFWLLGTVMAGIGVGEALRSETLEDWEVNQKACVKNSSKCKRQKRKSNISFNAEKLEKQHCGIIEQQSEISVDQKGQFSEEIQKINEELTKRPILAKILTVFFNLFSIVHVILVMLDDLGLPSAQDSAVNIVLLVITGLWVIGVIAGLFQYIRSQNKLPIQKGVLIYQGIALVATIIDYAGKVAQEGGNLVTSTSILTPVSHGLISLRIVYVIFNNGFSAYYSFYTEKLVANFWKNKRVLGIIILLGVSIGFAQAHIGQADSIKKTLFQVNNSVSMILGTGGGMLDTDISAAFFGVVKVVGFLVGIYIAKHFNLGYDTLMDIQLDEQYPKTVQFQEQPRVLPSLGVFSAENCLRSTLFKIHQVEYYHYFKIVLILAYTIISLLDNPQETTVTSSILLAIDIYLIFDILTQIIAYGLIGEHAYLNNLIPLKIIYMITQLYLCISFCIPQHNYPAIIILFRVCRMWILLCYVQKMTDALNTAIQILLHPKLEIYKVYLLGVPLILLGMALTARYAQEGLVRNSDNIGWILISYGVSYVYGLGCNFTSNTNDNEMTSSGQMTVAVMNLLFLGVILFFHVQCTFMMVTYFVNRRVRDMGEIEDQIFNNYGTHNPDHYDHVVYRDQCLSDYVKYLKLGIWTASMVYMCLLVGDTVTAQNHRLVLAVFNLVLLLLLVAIYVVENLCLKINGQQKWPLVEGSLLILSIPGAFLLVAPVIKYSSNSQGLRLALQVFQMGSGLHLLNIFSLITQRCGKPFTSRIWRRIYANIPFEEFGCLALLMLVLTLPFAASISLENQTDLLEEIIATLSGGYFRNQVSSGFQLIIKTFTIVVVFMPMKIMILARVISSFLTNRPNTFTVLHEEICEVIAQNGVLNQQQKSFHVLSNNYYRITKKLCQTFVPFSGENLKVQYFKDVENIYKKLNTPVFLFEEEPTKKSKEEVKKYGTFVYDIIYALYMLSKSHQTRANNIFEFHSLYQKSKPKAQHVFKTNLRSKTLAVMVKAKSWLKSGMYRSLQKKQNESYEKEKQSRGTNSRMKHL